VPLENASKHQHLQEKLDYLHGKQTRSQALPEVDSGGWQGDPDIDVDQTADGMEVCMPDTAEGNPGATILCPEIQSTKELQSTAASLRLHTNWAGVLPGLVYPLLNYITASIGSVASPVNNDIHSMCVHSCISNRTKILCLYFDRAYYILDLTSKFILTLARAQTTVISTSLCADVTQSPSFLSNSVSFPPHLLSPEWPYRSNSSTFIAHYLNNHVMQSQQWRLLYTPFTPGMATFY
jgi:hypothetical protein